MDSGCSSTIVNIILTTKIKPKEDSVMQWHMQSGNITTYMKVKLDCTLSELSTTKIITCIFHVDDSAKGKYNMILGRYLLTKLVLNIEFFE